MRIRIIIILLAVALIAVLAFAVIAYTQIPPLECRNNVYLEIEGVVTYVNNICYVPVMPVQQPVSDNNIPVLIDNKVMVLAKISHYDPSLGGPNCATFINGVCVSTMANGERWQDNIDKACACPPEYPFLTKFIVYGKEWVCKDRGSKIVKEIDGTIWLDLLTVNPVVPYGTILEVEIKNP